MSTYATSSHLDPDCYCPSCNKTRTALGLEPAQPVPLGDCGHPAWMCSCKKWREPATREEDPADVQHEPVTQEGY